MAEFKKPWTAEDIAKLGRPRQDHIRVVMVFRNMRNAEAAGFRGERHWRHLERPDTVAWWPAMGDVLSLPLVSLSHVIITGDLGENSAWAWDQNRQSLLWLRQRLEPGGAWIDLR